jgi:hypothetical protein
MQKAKVMQDFDQDLKEAVSGVKKEEYRKAVEEARDLFALDIVEHRIRTDFQPTQETGFNCRVISSVSPHQRVEPRRDYRVF